MRRLSLIAVGLLVAALFLGTAVAPAAQAGRPGLFTPNYTARFTGALSNAGMDIEPEQRWVQVDKTTIRSDMRYNNYPLDFDLLVFGPRAGRYMGYLAIKPDSSGTTAEFYYNWAEDRIAYQLYGRGTIDFSRSKSGQYEFSRFTATGPYTIYLIKGTCQIPDNCYVDWESDPAGLSFSIEGERLP